MPHLQNAGFVLGAAALIVAELFAVFALAELLGLYP